MTCYACDKQIEKGYVIPHWIGNVVNLPCFCKECAEKEIEKNAAREAKK